MMQFMSAITEDMSNYGKSDINNLEVTAASHIPALEDSCLGCSLPGLTW